MIIKRWSEWRASLRRAGEWEGAPDPGVRRLKALFAAARTPDNPRADAQLWRRLRAQIRSIDRKEVAASLNGAIASFGFRFAGAAACALALAIGLAWSQGPLSEGPAATGAQLASFVEAPEEALNGPLQARSGDDLLQFIAYASNR
ncbi:MAG: hypothetical protein A3J27_00765 [Candidatus Tectomicrobia bacterium RIFCSPLOWO2_12_FULL_69_37]|nr:MAG: hypothetical protein A3J27_00765 [Candidatus Tectomicrobia bacterium RIFCSPLOWO2_12_FULL_69_37]OGL61716.1 MAG: hypothetical protein A3I72_16775 [Candidatus Tectomicrobia bacterium RIFCSPLOWO2_02_FULL_70_19]